MSDARAFFGAIARRYDRVYALSGPASRGRLARVLREIEGRRRVLALGLGTGRELPALLDAGHDVTGLDVSPEMIALCNQRSRTVPTVEADFWAPLPFADASFDAAIALHGTIAHPPSDHAFADLGGELSRVLTPGGIFVAEVPAAEGLSRIAIGRSDEGMHVAATGSARFVHTDEVAGVSIEGVALDREGWRAAFAPFLLTTVEPLGEAEHLILATR